MLSRLERVLNARTMYEVMIYGLGALILQAFFFGAFGLLTYTPLALLGLLFLVVGACLAANTVFARIFKAPRNDESTLITALILFFLLSPLMNWQDAQTAVIASVLAVASKYLIAWRKQHLFNPVAFAAVCLGVLGNGGAVWWIGNGFLLPLMAIVGALITWKIRRWALVLSVIVSSTVVVVILGMLNGQGFFDAFTQHFLSWPIVFFATIMVTEPQTAPGRRRDQLAYGSLVGILSSIPFQFGRIFSTPELALVIGNVYSYVFSLRQRLILTFQEKKELAQNTYELSFSTPVRPTHEAGQYLEWTLPHAPADRRGKRRYFTIASSPTDDVVRLGVRTASPGSSFKQALLELKPGDKLYASQRAGDFVLPAQSAEILVFIAGGIGITPFVSMLRYCLETKRQQPIVLFNANKTGEDVAYHEVLERAERELGTKVIQVLAQPSTKPLVGTQVQGFITKEILHTYLPDVKQPLYYLSGPSGMVDVYKKLLREAGVPVQRIKTDYFPGFA